MTSRVLRTLLLLPTAFAVFAPPGVAQGRGQGNPHKQDEDQVQPIFRQRDREIIVDFFRTRRSGLPPGLAKRNGDLPPGLEKHLERNGTLPPGLQKRVESFPPDLERRLPRLPVIYRRGTIGPDVIILNRKTGAIVDIIRGVATVAGR
jgi:hypothetical protein